jgi:hypothetical protein
LRPAPWQHSWCCRSRRLTLSLRRRKYLHERDGWLLSAWVPLAPPPSLFLSTVATSTKIARLALTPALRFP